MFQYCANTIEIFELPKSYTASTAILIYEIILILILKHPSPHEYNLLMHEYVQSAFFSPNLIEL